jgi:hypothetical protein
MRRDVSRAGRRSRFIVAAVGLVLVVPAPAAAAAEPPPATPQQIYRDITDNGRLDRRYRSQDIERALRVSSDDERRLSPPKSPARPLPTTNVSTRDVVFSEFPFSRIDLALFGGAAALLLILAAAVRLRSRLATPGLS